MPTRPYLALDIPNFHEIQHQLIPYILAKYPGLLTFWNRVDQDHLFEHVPQLKSAILQAIGQEPLKTYLLVVPDVPDVILENKLGAATIHRDTSKETTRLNWPVLNSTSIETRIYETHGPGQKLVLPTGETYITYQESECSVIGTYCMDRPTLIHVHTTHGLYRAAGPLPRYILSFNFDRPIEHLLNG